jgi:hypothetical protein
VSGGKRQYHSPGTAGFPITRKYYAASSGGLNKTQKQLFNAMLNYRSVPAPDTFLYRLKPVAEQPFPALHRFLSQTSLSLLFTDELTVFRWQLSCYLKDSKLEEAELLSDRETTAFYHEKRKMLLSFASGEALINFIVEKATNKEPEVLPAYFSAFGISGIIDETDGNAVFLIFNPRVSIKILSIHRDAATYPNHLALRSMK